MNDGRRKLASRMADALMPTVGMVLVVIANESPDRAGHIEIDAGMRTGYARSETGGVRLVQFGQGVGQAVERLTRELADEWGAGDAP